jgi:hypothetical protein
MKVVISPIDHDRVCLLDDQLAFVDVRLGDHRLRARRLDVDAARVVMAADLLRQRDALRFGHAGLAVLDALVVEARLHVDERRQDDLVRVLLVAEPVRDEPAARIGGEALLRGRAVEKRGVLPVGVRLVAEVHAGELRIGFEEAA